MHDIVEIKAKGWAAQLEQLEVRSGINYNPHGLLGDAQLRAVIDPIKHYIRDWQHSICSNGVGSLEIAAVMRALKDVGIPIRLSRNLPASG